MDTPNPKRLCLVPSVTSSIENASSLPITPGCNQSNIDMTISSFLSLSDLPLFSSPLSIGCSFDRVLDKVIPSEAGTSRDEFDQDRFLDRTLQLASLLYKSTKRCIRKRATLQNSISWPLLPELTIKVFSMLDTKSLMQASACCTMFNKCAMDRVCYSHIDLTTAAKHVDNGVVCIMIHRAGKELRSLKLGSISPSAGYTASLLTRSCLTPLTFNHGFAGGLLRSLHLYCLSMMDIKSLSPVLSACLNLTDLKIVGLSNPVEQLVSLTRSCRLLEYLFIESYIGASFPTDPSLLEVVDNCPNLISLTLLRFRLNDTIAQKLIKGFRRLEYINLSSSPEMNGSFLRGLGLICKDSPLETLILRNCYTLKEREVLQFLNSLLARDFKSIKLIDVSSAHGLVSDERKRTFEPRFPIEELKKQRSDVRFVAIFESQSSRTEEVYSDGTSSGSYNYSSEEEEQEREHEEEEEEEEEEHDNELEDKMNADLTISAAQCHPDCVQANNAQEDYDASQSAAYVAVSLISSARVILKLDSKYTEYSAQYLVDNAGKEEVMRREMPRQSYEVSLENCLRSLTENVWHKWEDGQGSYCWRSKKKDGQGSRHELTVSKTALNFAFKKGLPTKGQWTHFGCTFNAPSFNKPRVPMNGQVIEAADLGEALKLCRQQPVGARPMCSVPSLILLERRIYEGPSGDSSRYVGLRDAFIVAFDKREGKIVVTVQIVYKKKTSFVKVSGRSMMLPLTGEDGSQVTEPTCLLVDFCLPRLSIN